jgi:hypothetical protein
MVLLFPLQIIPSSSNGQDASNFRRIKESNSLHLDDQMHGVGTMRTTPRTHRMPGLTGDDEMDLPAEGYDLFGAFSSVTLHYDGES